MFFQTIEFSVNKWRSWILTPGCPSASISFWQMSPQADTSSKSLQFCLEITDKSLSISIRLKSTSISTKSTSKALKTLKNANFSRILLKKASDQAKNTQIHIKTPKRFQLSQRFLQISTKWLVRKGEKELQIPQTTDRQQAIVYRGRRSRYHSRI